jgi:receptor protein-tyrosine kinase
MKMSLSELPDTQRRHLSLGSILIQQGLLSEGDARRVVQLQKQRKLRFGEAALQLGLLSDEDLRYALSRQFDYPYLRESGGGQTIDKDLIAAREPFDRSVEALRAIRSQLMLRWFDKPQAQNALAVVSQEAGEGRSYLAANLAVVFSQAGENTLLIDANLRTPRQHALFGLDNQAGLSGFLAGHTRNEPIVRIADIPGLFVLPAGALPPNPLELLSRPAWGAVLAEAQSTFDLVIVDTPALCQGEDAVLTAARAGSALVVARSHRTRLQGFTEMVRGLGNAGVNVAGSVLNDTAGREATA